MENAYIVYFWFLALIFVGVVIFREGEDRGHKTGVNEVCQEAGYYNVLKACEGVYYPAPVSVDANP